MMNLKELALSCISQYKTSGEIQLESEQTLILLNDLVYAEFVGYITEIYTQSNESAFPLRNLIDHLSAKIRAEQRIKHLGNIENSIYKMYIEKTTENATFLLRLSFLNCKSRLKWIRYAIMVMLFSAMVFIIFGALAVVINVLFQFESNIVYYMMGGFTLFVWSNWIPVFKKAYLLLKTPNQPMV